MFCHRFPASTDDHLRAVKQKKCKVCSLLFTPYSSLTKACSIPCALKLAQMETQKQYRRDKIEYRKRTEPRKSQLAKVQAAVNSYIRTRDKGKPCISCEGFKEQAGLKGGSYDAGHWFGRGAHPSLRFVLWNIHKQCVTCNQYLNGHPHGYEAGLIKRFGREWVERRKQQARDYKTNHYSKQDLERIRKIFTKKQRLYAKLFRG